MEILEPFGEARLVGNVALYLVVKPDIDIHLILSATSLASSKMLLLFPEGQFLLAVAMAIISEGRGKRRKARRYAKQALKALEVRDSGLDGRPDVG